MADVIVSATTARIKLYNILEEVDKLSKRVTITKQGQAKAVLVNPDELAGLEETLEILADKRAIVSIQKSLAEIKAGKILTFKEVTGEEL